MLVEVYTNLNEHARIFDSESCYWKDEKREYNWIFVRVQEAYSNDLLRRKGSVLLNHVYEMLDLPIADPDSRLGWKYDPDKGEQQIVFSVYPDERIHASEASCLVLDFNADTILD